MNKILGRELGLLLSTLVFSACTTAVAQNSPALQPVEKTNMFACWAHEDLAALPNFKASMQRYLNSKKQPVDILVGVTDSAKLPKDVPKLFGIVYSDSPLEERCADIFGPGFSGAPVTKNRFQDFRFMLAPERPEDLIDNGSQFNPSENTAFIVLARKPEIPRSEFLAHMTKHVVSFSQLMSAYTLDGYVVWATPDYEFTFVKFADAKASALGLKAPFMKHFFEDQHSFLDHLQKNTMVNKNFLMKFSNH